MKWIILMLSSIMILSISAYPSLGLHISEIMFNPQGADTGREWIELTVDGDECINLSEYRLFESGSNHNINAFDEEIFCGYAIICLDMNKFLQDYPYLNNSINHTSLYKSTFGLINSGEELAIKKSDAFIDYMNYSLLLDQITMIEGYTLEYNDDVWMQSMYINGNPGNILRNAEVSHTNNSTNHTEENISIINMTDDTLNDTINYIQNNTVSDINDTIDTANDTIDAITNTTINYTVDHTINDTINDTLNYVINLNESVDKDDCSASIKIYLKNESGQCERDPEIRENNVAIKFYNKIEFFGNISTKNYSIEYWVEDLKGNIVKNKMTTNNQDEKSFTPKIEESDKILIIQSLIKDIDCNISNGTAEKMLLIQNKDYTLAGCPKCESCESKTTKCPSCTFETTEESHIPCSAPLIKTVNVCNNSCSDKQQSQALTIQGTQSKNMAVNSDSTINSTNDALEEINSKRNKTTGLTGMVIYESPNLKNRFYAIIGLIFVGLTSMVFFIYRSKFLDKIRDINRH